MRLFEIVILASILLVLLGCLWPRSQRPPWLVYVPGLALALVGVHLIVEGYRWQMVPAYSLAALLFLVFVPQLRRGHTPPDGLTSRRWRISGACLGFLWLVFAAVVPVLLPVFRPPEPTGAFEVGTRTLSMVDEARPETLTIDPDDERELAIRVWYPASPPAAGEEPAPWEEAPSLGPALAREADLPPFAFDYFSLVRSHAYPDASLAGTGRDHPVLVFSHGYSQGWASQNNSLMEELASHGYVVFSVAHTYEALMAMFPGGRTIPRDDARVRTFFEEGEKIRRLEHRYLATADPVEKGELYERLQEASPVVQDSLDIWTRDTAFVVDELEKMDRGDGPFAGALDTSRLGVFGHSFGGATAGQFCLADRRCKAGLNLDGVQYGDPRDWDGLNRPFMMVTSGENTGMDGSLIQYSNGPTYRLSVEGSTHLDFTDLTLVSPLFRWAGYLGPASGERMARTTNAYVLAFFDEHLLGQDSPLLEGDSSEYPEATLQAQDT